MYLAHLALNNFRNYRRLELAPTPGVALIAGANAQGKTNLLESIYLLATTRAARGLRRGRADPLGRGRRWIERRPNQRSGGARTGAGNGRIVIVGRDEAPVRAAPSNTPVSD